MSDIFLDIFMEKLKKYEMPKRDLNIDINMDDLPEPKDTDQAAVDGGGGQTRLEGGLSIRIARAILIGNNILEKDLDLEIDEWDSLSSLEALRSSLELSLANRSNVLTFVDGSAYTQLSAWITRIIKIALGKAKSSEIVALPRTLSALNELLKLNKSNVAFIAKEPKFRILKEVILAQRLTALEGRDYSRCLRDGPLDKKQLYVLIMKHKQILRPLSSPSLLDSHIVTSEGVSKGITLGLPKKLRNRLFPSEFRKILNMAAEMYKFTVGRDIEIPRGLEGICYMRAPIIWWVKYGRWKITIEEFSGPPLCLAPYREMGDVKPRTLAAFLSQSGSNYHAWLSLAHSLSTMRSEHFMTYLNILREQKDLSISTTREELLYLK